MSKTVKKPWPSFLMVFVFVFDVFFAGNIVDMLATTMTQIEDLNMKGC